MHRGSLDFTGYQEPRTGAEQATPTENTIKKCEQFLDYAASQEEEILTYTKSDMVLAIHSDASYLSESKAIGSWQGMKKYPQIMGR